MTRPTLTLPEAVWWTDPAKLLACFIIPLYIALFLSPQLLGRSAMYLEYRVYWTLEYFWLGLAFLLVALIGTLMGRLLYPSRKHGSPSAPVSPLFLEVLAVAAIVAYIIWFRVVFLKPWILVQSLTEGFIATNRLESRTIAGITTLTQLGIAYVILFLDWIWRSGQRPLPRRFHVYFWMLIALAAMRVFVWAERLALLELLVPAGVMYFMHRGIPKMKGARIIVPLLPVLGIAALLMYFGATEYFRSWASHYRYDRYGFVEFISKRVLTYYYTSLNNGAGLLAILEWPTFRFEYLFSGLFRFPLLLGPIFRFTLGAQPSSSDFLTRYADPEFTNMSGIFTVFYDIGVGGGILYALIWGLTCGYFFNSCRVGMGIGRTLYPLVYVSILEVFRFPYLSESRAFPAIVLLLLGYWLAREQPERAVPSHARLRARRHRLVGTPGWLERVGASLRRR